jgi:hypothetical protein
VSNSSLLVSNGAIVKNKFSDASASESGLQDVVEAKRREMFAKGLLLAVWGAYRQLLAVRQFHT